MICSSCFVFLVCGANLILPRWVMSTNTHAHTLAQSVNWCVFKWTFLPCIKEFSLEPQHSFVRFGCCVLASLFFHYISHLRPPSRVSLCALFFFLLLLMFPLSLAEFDKSNDCRGVVLVVMVMVHTWICFGMFISYDFNDHKNAYGILISAIRYIPWHSR